MKVIIALLLATATTTTTTHAMSMSMGGRNLTQDLHLRGANPNPNRKLLGYDDNLCGEYDTANNEQAGNMEKMGRLVEMGKGCYQLTKVECCSYFDGRNNQYGGQLCVPPEDDEFPNGNECEPANFASRQFPDDMGTCEASEYMNYPDILLDDCSMNALQEVANRVNWVMEAQVSNSQLQEMCEQARQDYTTSERATPISIAAAIEKSDEFVVEYYQGQGEWNLETEDNNGNNELAEDAAIIDAVQEMIANHRPMAEPAWMESCEMNAVMCLFRRDRQANDNNGNCAEQYEQNCVDAEPADNSDLCYSDRSTSSRIPGVDDPEDEGEGLTFYKRSNGNCQNTQNRAECCQRIDENTGENCVPSASGRFSNGQICMRESWVEDRPADLAKAGFCEPDVLGFNIEEEHEIHAHGLAWDDEGLTNDLKANVLFYVSMYDHLYTRGYVENFQGAPMCGCLEEMPVVSRADCTYPTAEERFVARYDEYGAFMGIMLRDMDISFNACNGNTNNDLYSYIRDRLDDPSAEEAREYLVGPENNNDNQGSNCRDIIQERFGDAMDEKVEAEGMVASRQSGISCEDVQNNLAGPYTCLARILYLQNVRQMSQSAARQQVAEEFPSECGPCASG